VLRIGAQRRYQPVVKPAVLLVQWLIAFEHNIIEIAAGRLTKKLGGCRAGKRTRCIGGKKSAAVALNDMFELRDHQIGRTRRD
jgi:hypothetical protein